MDYCDSTNHVIIMSEIYFDESLEQMTDRFMNSVQFTKCQDMTCLGKMMNDFLKGINFTKFFTTVRRTNASDWLTDNCIY